MASITLGLLLLTCASCCFAQNYQSEALNLHNQYRAKHSSPALQLDNTLNTNAVRCAKWLADQGKLVHRCPYNANPRGGENLAYNFEKTETAAARDATNRWYNEVKKYDYNRPGFSMETGHFTQVVWKSSTKLGVGVYRDPRTGRQYVVALYSEPGNMEGRFPQNVLRP